MRQRRTKILSPMRALIKDVLIILLAHIVIEVGKESTLVRSAIHTISSVEELIRRHSVLTVASTEDEDELESAAVLLPRLPRPDPGRRRKDKVRRV